MTAESLPAAHAKAHPSARTYVFVFAWLAVMTAIEVLVASAGLPETLKVAILVVLAVVKAALVVLFYMHLRYDSFYYWIILLVPIFFVVLLTRYLILR